MPVFFTKESRNKALWSSGPTHLLQHIPQRTLNYWAFLSANLSASVQRGRDTLSHMQTHTHVVYSHKLHTALDSVHIPEVSRKICVIARLKCKGNVPAFVETALTVNAAHVLSIGNYLYIWTQIFRDTDWTQPLVLLQASTNELRGLYWGMENIKCFSSPTRQSRDDPTGGIDMVCRYKGWPMWATSATIFQITKPADRKKD